MKIAGKVHRKIDKKRLISKKVKLRVLDVYKVRIKENAYVNEDYKK